MSGSLFETHCRGGRGFILSVTVLMVDLYKFPLRVSKAFRFYGCANLYLWQKEFLYIDTTVMWACNHAEHGHVANRLGSECRTPV